MQQRRGQDLQFNTQVVWMAYIPVDALLHRRPFGSGYGHYPRRPAPAQRADGGQAQRLTNCKHAEGRHRKPGVEFAPAGEDFQQHSGEPSGMQAYDPAIRLGCVLAPAALAHPPLVTPAQAQLEQALQTQASHEARKQQTRYHCSSTSSALNAGPIAISNPYSPGFGCKRFIALSRISSTEADEMLPVSARLSQLSVRASSGRSSPSSSAWITLGPPGCTSQWSMPAMVRSCLPRNASMMGRTSDCANWAMSALSSTLKPLFVISQPMICSVSGKNCDCESITLGMPGCIRCARGCSSPTISTAAAPSPKSPLATKFAIDRSSRWMVRLHSSTANRITA